jgi:hypothetical protein
MKILKTKKYSILRGVLKYSFVIVFSVMLIAPVVWAVDPPGCGVGEPGCGVGGTNITTTIKNPLGENITDIPSFIEAVINIVLIVGIPVIALAIIYTGFLFVSAQGNPEKLTKAKSSLLYTLIGAALLLGAFLIAEAIGKTVEDIKSTT